MFVFHVHSIFLCCSCVGRHIYRIPNWFTQETHINDHKSIHVTYLYIFIYICYYRMQNKKKHGTFKNQTEIPKFVSYNWSMTIQWSFKKLQVVATIYVHSGWRKIRRSPVDVVNIPVFMVFRSIPGGCLGFVQSTVLWQSFCYGLQT